MIEDGDSLSGLLTPLSLISGGRCGSRDTVTSSWGIQGTGDS